MSSLFSAEGSLAMTALLMGLAGGPHCLMMCGAACAGIARAGEGVASGDLGGEAQGAARLRFTLLWFQLGRIMGYGALGALAASSMQGVGWLSTQSAVFRPVWSFLHIAALLLGLVLLWRGDQPLWLQSWGRAIWQRVQRLTVRLPVGRRGATLVLGCLWALMPCGLLYGALMVAALSNSAAAGAWVMALFALGSAVVLTLGPWAWLRLGRLRSRRPVPSVSKKLLLVGSLALKLNPKASQGVNPSVSQGIWGVRLAGLALAASSGWALWMGLVHAQAPWCLVP